MSLSSNMKLALATSGITTVIFATACACFLFPTGLVVFSETQQQSEPRCSGNVSLSAPTHVDGVLSSSGKTIDPSASVLAVYNEGKGEIHVSAEGAEHASWTLAAAGPTRTGDSNGQEGNRNDSESASGPAGTTAWYVVDASVTNDVYDKLAEVNERLDELASSGTCPLPVGSVFQTATNDDPNETWPGTTWTKIEGTFLLSSSSAYALGSTGGEATHTLSVNEMPSHTHTQNSHNHTQNAHNHTQAAHSHTVNGGATTTGGGGSHSHALTGWWTVIAGGSGTTRQCTAKPGEDNENAGNTNSVGNHTHSVPAHTHSVSNATPTINNTTATNNATTATNQNTGGGAAHNNMPPYEVVNIWQRTA